MYYIFSPLNPESKKAENYGVDSDGGDDDYDDDLHSYLLN